MIVVAAVTVSKVTDAGLKVVFVTSVAASNVALLFLKYFYFFVIGKQQIFC